MLAICSASVVLAGCTVKMSYKETHRYPNGEITTSSGEVILTDQPHAILLRPISSLMANLGVFDYEDWVDLDASKFHLNVDDGAATSYVDGSNVELTIWDDNSALGTKSFATTMVGDDIYFANPQAVEDWAYNYIDIADRVTYDIDIFTETTDSTLVTVSSHDDGGSYASTTYTASKTDDKCQEFGCDPL